MTRDILSASTRTASTSSTNNFDAIRLFAAAQVALSHAISHLDIKADWAYPLNFFPGVPIFFFISGFLIFQSWNNIKVNRAIIFFTNRILRLYPALLTCFAFSATSIFYSGYLDDRHVSLAQVWILAISQITFFQFYNPDFLRGYGVGVINGSLWTISAELQFYVLTPLIHFLYSHYRRLAIGGFLLFVIFNIANTLFNNGESFVGKIISVTFVPWLFMFLFGAYVSTNKKLQDYFLKLNTTGLIFAYILIYYISMSLNIGSGNGIGFLPYVILSALIVKLAFTRPELSNFVLKKNDISYGVYIYHMPIINLFIFYGFTHSYVSLASAIFFTGIAALISWVLVERPALHLKAVALRRY